LAFYKGRFGDASNFTFVFVGSFKPETIKPLVETYIASLPATHARETWRDVGVASPAGIVERTVEKGIEQKSEVTILFSGPFDYDDQHRLALRTMALLLESRLSDAIRQELGGTYSITATPGAQRFPRPEFSVRIDWTCDPARTSSLVQRVFEEIKAIKATPISRGQVTRIRDILLREYETNSQDNGYLLHEISRRYEDGQAAELAAVGNLPDQIAALTGDAIQQAAERYLNTQNYVKVTLVPEAKSSGL
jgi:zinc protease